MDKQKTIHELLPMVARDIGVVGKNRINADQKFKFRGIDDLLNAAHGALVDHGVTIVPRVTSRDVVRGQTKSGSPNIWVGLTIDYTFYAQDGSNVTATVMSEGLDMSDKATNKALSAGLKYALIQVFSVPTEDMDDSDATTPELPHKYDQREHLDPLLEAQRWGIENLDKLQLYNLLAEWQECTDNRDLQGLRALVKVVKSRSTQA